VTAVQISPFNGPSHWQQRYEAFSEDHRAIAAAATAADAALAPSEPRPY